MSLVMLLLQGAARPVLAASTTRVSVASDGTQANASSGEPVISSDGRYVTFSSDASNLVPGDTNAVTDVFVYDRLTGTVERVSVDGAGNQGNGASNAVNLSGDGRFVVFNSSATNLVLGDTNAAVDVFLHDRLTGATERISVNTAGIQGNGSSQGDTDISDDGRFVAFQSDATNFITGDTNGTTDVFVRDRTAGTTSLVSVSTTGTVGNARSPENSGCQISPNGRYVVFPSIATDLVPGDTNGQNDVFMRDLLAGTTERVSVSTSGTEGNGLSAWPDVSTDGRFVVYSSLATNLVGGDNNNTWDDFVRDRQAHTTERVSLGPGGIEANANSGYTSISSDGRIVAFTSRATNLVPGDTNGIRDVFVRDRVLGVTERVSVSSSGGQATGPDNEIGLTSVSADGRFVVFSFSATDLVPGDTNGVPDAFIRDRGAPTTPGAPALGLPQLTALLALLGLIGGRVVSRNTDRGSA